MQLNTTDSLPWAKDYLRDGQIAVGNVYPLLCGKLTDKGGVILETEDFKVYCFPKSAASMSLIKWLEDSLDQTVPAMCVEVVAKYPGFILTDEHEYMTQVHFNIMGNITLTPTLIDAPTTKRKRKLPTNDD